MAHRPPPSRLHATRHESKALLPKNVVTMFFQYLTTFLRQSRLSSMLGLWGNRSSAFILDGLRPIRLSELLKRERPATPGQFGPLHPQIFGSTASGDGGCALRLAGNVCPSDRAATT
eukprot:6175260-Pleurochrysis_carterae.AAC.1